ncbi:ATP-dependent DNA helicase pif1 [Eumeta japonica]|uniref:ATP-dependent DNA helicase n=1 Tax=Eumeta variegata TaxID=151549 RepID=A0A4C1VF42_EUMVA|nr:ATP-dependent DNA helicase pif1 [Eumeta japonica]
MFHPQNGPIGKLLQDASLIMWDECTMSHRAHIEAVNRTLQDLRNSSAVMGGITFVFAGDFRQTLPVINRGTRADIIKACLKSSPYGLRLKH